MSPISAAERNEERKNRYEVLLRLAEILASSGIEKLSASFANQLHRVLNFDVFDILTVREGAARVIWSASNIINWVNKPAEQRATQWIYENRRELLISDWRRDAQFPEFREALKESGTEIRSLYGVPLTAAQNGIGVLYIASSNPGAYDAQDRRFVTALAEMLALAISNGVNVHESSQIQNDLERQNTRLKSLLDLTNSVTSNLELHDLLRAVSTNIRQVMNCDGVAIALPSSEQGKLEIYGMDFPHGKGLVQEKLVLSHQAGPPHRAFTTLQPVVSNPLNPDEYSSDQYQIVAGEGVKAQCFIPLVSRGRALGLLVLGRLREDSFLQDEVRFLSQMAGQIAIAVENALAYQDISRLKDKLAQEKLYLEDEIRNELNFEQIIGTSPALKRVLELVATVAPSDSTVLLLGETGTGKELIARAIHDHSRRKGRTFVKLNCAAIPTGLLESELFGHEKGAFTGAISQKIGRLELADQGTLFLDEAGDIPLEIQPKLLRVLQEQEFERLGSTRTKKVNVRIVAATNRDLQKMIDERLFRSDLFYRLNVFPIQIPPLRDRREDIPLLVRYFVQKHSRYMQKAIESIPSTALRKLTAMEWPGNIRELENFIERAVILTHGRSLKVPMPELNLGPSQSLAEHVAAPPSDDVAQIVRETIRELKKHKSSAVESEYDARQKQQIISALREAKGRVGGRDGAAARLGLKRTTLISRMEKYDISSKQYS